MVRPADPEGARAAWAALEQTWAATIARADRLTDAQRHERVDGEWSFVETLRHLLFAMDKWFTAPILGEGFHPIGMPNSGSVDFPWPDLDRDAAPSYDEVLAARAQRADRFRAWLDELEAADLTREVEVLENGTVTVHDCVFTVLEEEFEHDRYADRDLAVLESRAGGDRPSSSSDSPIRRASDFVREERHHLREGGDNDQVEEELERGHPLFGFGANRPCLGRTLRLRHELQRRRSRPRREGAVDDARGVPSVLLPVRLVDPSLEVGVGLDERDVLLNATRSDPALVASLGTVEPVGCAPVHRPDVEVVVDPHHPDRPLASQHPVGSERRDLQLVRSLDLLELVGRPPGHRSTSFQIVARFRASARLSAG